MGGKKKSRVRSDSALHKELHVGAGHLREAVRVPRRNSYSIVGGLNGMNFGWKKVKMNKQTINDERILGGRGFEGGALFETDLRSLR